MRRFLRILPFVDNPARGVQKIREVIALPWVYLCELRGVATALGYSRCDAALDLLRELASDPLRAQQLGDDWIDAITALNAPAARNLLLSFADPDIVGLPEAVRFDRQDVLTARITDVARRDPAIQARLRALCDFELPAPKRFLLAKVMNFLGTPEAVLWALNLVDDQAQPRYDFDTWEQLENAIVQKKPYGQIQGSYTLSARAANEVRLRLFEMLNDQRRKPPPFRCLDRLRNGASNTVDRWANRDIRHLAKLASGRRPEPRN